MKKILALAVALVLGFAGAAMAMQAEIPADTTAAIAKGGTQVTIGGELRFRGSTYQNISDFNRFVANGSGFGAAERAVFESRIRLGVEAKVSPNTIGYIQLEAAGSGDNLGENTTWGTEGTKTLGGTYKSGDVKQNEMRVMQAWVQHSGSGLFGVPAYIKVGHQPVVVGAGVFYRHNLYNDDAIIAGITPIKGLDLSAVYVKLNEGLNNSADDLDLYSGIITYAFNKDIVAGIDVSMLQAQQGTAGLNKFDLWNIGINGKANVAGFKLKATVDLQTGQMTNPTTGKYNFRGYAITAGAAYTFAPVTVALDLGYGSGDNTSDHKLGTFMTSQAHIPTIPGTFIYEYLVNNAAGNLAGGLQNTAFGKLSANADVMKDLNIGASITLLRSAKKAYGDGNYLVGNTTTSSSYIGTEIDINASYQIDKGLKYFVEGGYLFAGNFWKGAGAGWTDSSGNKKLSDPWGIRHGLQLNF